MKRLISIIGLLFLAIGTAYTQQTKVIIEGELKKWHKTTLSFTGNPLGENNTVNPFLNYRLIVTFKNGDKVYVVPGFYAADGNAAETSATEGKIWQVRFTPDKIGEWSYEVSFRRGNRIAISNDPNVGEPIAFDGQKGKFNISDTDKKGKDFRAKGRLQYTGERYLRFVDNKEYFLKGGADSPENFLGYYDFDQTPGTHKFEAHSKDWRQGDPSWQNGKGKNMIGALNYLASKGMNSVYFLTMNVQGDGKDVWPWNNIDERYRFDCSKLDQWEIIFDHMDTLGLMLHIVTQETENELLLDIGELGVQRKLYYRELIARFSHHLAITWNLGEENGPVHWSPKGQNDDDRKAMAKYIKENDPYQNFVALHTHSVQHQQEEFLRPLLGFESLDGPSMQIHHPNEVHEVTKHWIDESRKTDRIWVVNQDEIGPADTGVKPDADDPGHNEIRHKVLWGNLMAGGAGVEWYFGYKYAHNDLNCEDWRSRDEVWNQTKYALDFFQTHLPFTKMDSADGLTDNSDDYVFSLNGSIYAIYLPKVTETYIDLFGSDATFSIKWYNPRTGGKLNTGTVKNVKGGKKVSIGFPPTKENDWVALLKANKQTANTINTEHKDIPVVLKAVNDFEISSGPATYYKDTPNGVLAIDAEKEGQRNKFAEARTIFKGETGLYALSFISMAENDGESSYIIKVNGSILDTLVNPQVNESFRSIRHNLGEFYLRKKDIVQIRSNSVSNGKIPENGETAWSRGRWDRLICIPARLSMEEQLKEVKPFVEKEGFLEVEAEEFQYVSANGTKRNWYIRSAKNVVPFSQNDVTHHYESASNGAYIEALPDTRVTHADPLLHGENFFPSSGDGGIVSYKVAINNPGKYFIWARAYSSGTEDNGVHVGLNGAWPESGSRIQWCEGKDQWTWSSAQRVPEDHCGVPNTIYLDIETAGDYIISFSMREDGFEMDKWIMTKDAQFIPE